MDYKEIIKRAKSLGFADCISIYEIKDYYGEEIANMLRELFSSYVRKHYEEFTLYNNSTITLTDETDKDGLPIIRYKANYKHYPKHAWVGLDDYLSGQIVYTIDKVMEILQKYIEKYECKEVLPPFVQSEETKYENNEYENMPSLDYRNHIGHMNNSNKNLVDWEKVGEICNKHGFLYTIINSTFGGNDCEFVVYTNPSFSEAQYNEWLKNKDYDTIREQMKLHESVFRRLHDCVHELDENTRLVFRTGWAGNCGIFGSDDVKRQSYSFGSWFDDWRYISDKWSPLIHDTDRKLKKGVYIMMSTYYMK